MTIEKNIEKNKNEWRENALKLTTNDENILTVLSILGCEMRIGIGVDHHRLIKSEKEGIILGGVLIEGVNLTLQGNSDGDVIVHALCNAISTALGGSSLSEIADEMCLEKGVKDSTVYLKYFLDWAKEQQWLVNNVSISVEALRPKLEQWNEKIRGNLAKILEVDEEKIGLAFTTGEGLTECGKGAGIMAEVIVSMIRLQK